MLKNLDVMMAHRIDKEFVIYSSPVATYSQHYRAILLSIWRSQFVLFSSFNDCLNYIIEKALYVFL